VIFSVLEKSSTTEVRAIFICFISIVASSDITEKARH